MGQYPLGSQWRRWDMHLHTPSSYDYRNKGVSDEALIEALVAASVECAAITDHHVIDTARLKRLRDLAGRRVAVLPGIELRTQLGGRESVHIVGLFDLPGIADVWMKLQVELGLTPKEVAARGDDSVYVDFAEAAQCIHKHGGLVCVHAGRKSNTIERISGATKFKQQVKADLLRDHVDMLEVGSPEQATDYTSIVFPDIGAALPLLTASDCHNCAKYPAERACWVKADPTFLGLRQLCNEPVDRVSLDTEPRLLARVQRNRTKHVSFLRFAAVDNRQAGTWFDSVEVQLNPGLVAIIGRRGSGKSALAETIGLLGNCSHVADFSFLKASRFRRGKRSLASCFSGELQWASGDTTRMLLSEDPPLGASEAIRYIPQSYLERICNEISDGKGSDFDRELKAVIFSHLGDDQTLDARTLDEVIARRTSETEQGIRVLVAELQTLNAEIALLENKSGDDYIMSLQEALDRKQSEIDDHRLQKPKRVAKPRDTASSKSRQRLDELRTRLAVLEQATKDAGLNRKGLGKKLQSASDLEGRLTALQKHQDKFVEANRSLFKLHDIDIGDVVKVSIDTGPIRRKADEYSRAIERLADELDPETEGSTTHQLTALKTQIGDLQSRLDEPNKQYQKYLTSLEQWRTLEAELAGNSSEPATKKGIEAEIAAAKEAPKLASGLREKRSGLLAEIHDAKMRLAQQYEKLYAPVQAFIENHRSAEALEMEFKASIRESGFLKDFFAHVSHHSRGSYYGIEEGEKLLTAHLEKADFNTAVGVAKLIDAVVASLLVDSRTDQPNDLRSQLKNGNEVGAFYNMLYSLDYLTPQYQLRWGGKDIDVLSPGERGALLLVFYLLVDQDEMPLVIDQPEENLDNESVYRVLATCLDEARDHRQVIIVTHNPNLAVAADADQVICAVKSDGEGSRIDYETGAIEDPSISQHLVDILEGTAPAFRSRKRKYETAGHDLA